MRILITSLVDVKNSQHNRLHQFVKYLSKHHEITIICLNDWWKKEQMDEEDTYFNDVLHNVEVKHVTTQRIPPILQEVFFPFFIRVKKNYDIHLAYGTLISGYYIAKLFEFKNVPTIMDIADDNIGMIQNSPQIPKPLRGVGVFLGRYFSDKIINISEKVILTTMSLNEIYNIPAKKIIIIPNGVDTDLFKNLPSNKERFDISASFIVGFVGALREWVDLKPVFLAIKNLSKKMAIKMIIVGKEGMFLDNKRLAEECGVSKDIIFAGHAPYQNIPEFIAAMDVCVIPFKLDSVSRNSLPLKLFEYMACGKPVISTRLPNIEKLVKDSVLYANNEKEFEDAIMELYKNPEKIKELSLKGIKIAKANSWENILEKFNNDLLGGY
jgi:glycosyltransferase involved in cell wall biosynthesis